MVTDLNLTAIREAAVSCLVEKLGEKLLGLALFGSIARGEGSERSDLDFFVVTRGMEGSRQQRKIRIYGFLAPVNGQFRRDISVFTLEREEIREVTPLLINIAHDAVILFDPEIYLKELFKGIRKAVRKAGLVPYRTRDGKIGWKTKRKLDVGEIIEVKL